MPKLSKVKEFCYLNIKRWSAATPLFVLPGFRGRKIGRTLARGIIDEARTRGYERMRLDTIESMTEAKQLYRSLGFRPIKPYRYNPLDNPTYFEMDLRERSW